MKQQLDYRLLAILFGAEADRESGLTSWVKEGLGLLPGSLDSLIDGAITMSSMVPAWAAHFSAGDGNDDSSVQVASERLLRELGDRGFDTKPAKEQIAAIQASNLARLTRMTLDGDLNYVFMNDSAEGLLQAMWLGSVGGTTNPVIINALRKSNAEYWGKVRDSIRARCGSPEETAEEMAISAVVMNAELLRFLYDASGKTMGLMSFQLDPTQAFDPEAMLKQGLAVWERLTNELHGTPNIVFKVPGTAAGLEVTPELVSVGIGVNVTVNFSTRQHIAFGEAIEKHSARKELVSFLTQMDGRGDDQILKELGDTPNADEIAKWGSALVRQQIFDQLYNPGRGGRGLTIPRHLPAAVRGAWNIERSLQNEANTPPTFGTIFPAWQKDFDSAPRDLRPDGMWRLLPGGYLDILRKSRTFCQEYYVDGMTVEEFDTHPPTVVTLEQFTREWNELVEYCA